MSVLRMRAGVLGRYAALAIAVLGIAVLAALASPDGARAEDPRREFRFAGRAVIDGAPAAKGESVEIRIQGSVIASSQIQDDEGHWTLNVDADLLAKGVCDAIFYVGGRRAERQWNRCTVNIVLEVGKPDAPIQPPDPRTDPPSDPPTDPPTDPPSDPPTDPPSDPPTDPPTDPPSDPPTDPPTDPPSDPPTDPPTDPPSDPPDEPTADPPADPLDETPPDEPEGSGGADDASSMDSAPRAERPQTPPRTGTGGLRAESGGTLIRLLGLVAAVTAALGLVLVSMARRRRTVNANRARLR